MRAVYLGHEALTFADYIDLDTGRTLAAEPGGTYDLAPAGGRPVPDIPQGWFSPAGQQDIGRRFRWLTAPRSTVVQAGPVHTGMTREPDAEIDRLLRALVLRPR